MNRCQRISLSRSLALALAGGLCTFFLWTTAANAQQQQGVREFPAAAKRGILVVNTPPDVLLNGTAERLSPGVRIRDPNNLLVMSASLVGKRLVVNYLRGQQDMIQEVWLLTPAEAELKRSGSEPIINFNFGFEGDKPKTDDGKTPFDQLPKFPKQ